MSLTDRDRKILLALVPLVLIVAYWFVILAPKRQEATKIQDQLTQAQSKRDTAVQQLASLGAAKRSFAQDYATVIYLGKSIPTAVDMPSLMVQLDRATRGTGIRFLSIKAGDRSTGAASTGTGTGTGTSTAAGSSSSALDSVPLDFEFNGSYFDLTRFFHRMKRFVRVSNDRVIVRGRLMTINSFSFQPNQSGPGLDATAHATVYLAPKAEGSSAGATPTGPAAAPASQPAQSASSSSTPPAATVTVR